MQRTQRVLGQQSTRKKGIRDTLARTQDVRYDDRQPTVAMSELPRAFPLTGVMCVHIISCLMDEEGLVF